MDKPELPWLVMPEPRPQSGFERALQRMRPPSGTRRKLVRESKKRNARRRELWLAMSHKKQRERDAELDLSLAARAGRTLSDARVFRASMRLPYYDQDGWPMSMRSWCWAIEDRRAKHVALTKVLSDPDVWVSTVWLGLDHGHNFYDAPDYRPVIFETMIFGGPLDQDYQERYCTRAEALVGHERAIEVARKGEMPEGEDMEPPINKVLRALESEPEPPPSAPVVQRMADDLGLSAEDVLSLVDQTAPDEK